METIETVEQPKVYSVEKDECYFNGEHISIFLVFVVGFLIGHIIG